jgi:putative protein-disulfide isomerase
MKPLLIYCYDAYCGWCFGFSPVMKKIAANFAHKIDLEILSGGMLTGDAVAPIEKIAPVILNSYQRVEALTGIKFGEDFLWHARNPDLSDWILNSEKPAVALCILKEIQPHRQLEFATALQHALNMEGRDLDDDEAYRHLLTAFGLDETEFYQKLHSEVYKDMARHEFAMCRQLQVTGFPALLLQTGENKFYLVARGFTTFDEVKLRMENILAEIDK